MEVSPQDPSLMAMDLSKGYSVNPLTCSHPEATDVAKKPEWYHRLPPSCSTEISSPYRSRASSSFNSQLHPELGAPALCRDMEQGPHPLGNYMNSTLAPGLDLYHDGVHGNLWHPGFYGPDPTGDPVPESSGGEESDSGSDVIFLLSSTKEPLLCGSFIQDSVRHIVEPLSPAVSSPDEGRGCYHLPRPLSSPSPDSSYSEDSSDSSVDIPVHHTRPIVLLSDLSAVYGNPPESPVDVSRDDSDVIEVSVTNKKKKSSAFSCKKGVSCRKRLVRKTPPQSEDEKASHRVRRSTRIRKSVSEIPQYTCSVSRHSLRRQAKMDAVGIYNESCDSDEMMEYAVRLFSSDANELASKPNESQRASSNSEESDVDRWTDSKSPQRKSQPPRKVFHAKSANHKLKKPRALRQTKKLGNKPKQNCRIATEQHEKKRNKTSVATRKKRARPQTGPSALFSPREPEIKLKYANNKQEKKNKKLGNFSPFIHLKKRMCTVVNYQEEEAKVRSSRARQQTATRSRSGFVPRTSCFQLGRSSSQSRCQATLLCCLCGQTANAMGLGDLHGPYYSSSPSLGRGSEQKEDEYLLVSRRSVNASDDGFYGYDCSTLLESDDHSIPKVPFHLDEGWIHEDCGIWSAGVFLVRGKLYGLEEAARLAQETICSACQQTGAIMGCFQKGCPRNYHYSCAIQSGCVLKEDNFSIRCPEHKNILVTSVRRQHKR
ncbi:transcription factor 20-like [Etheostoma cragini]|uniref:transcription factor 20-like n=1 Tax=Etheostoma cragini TaxID=417921 RepID=UPI00155F2AD8|nr:transcription factor 20-like [Etheostoma cragini]